MGEVKLLITDFDGTLVDTFEANFLAYQMAFKEKNLVLSREDYRECFGLRFDDFMAKMGIFDEKNKSEIRRIKGTVYPSFFDKLVINIPLLSMLRGFKASGGLTALASTARRNNLLNALNYIKAYDVFSLIVAGEDVKKGKPEPEIYNKILDTLQVKPTEALIFEDSMVGMMAAQNAGVQFIQITKKYFCYGDRS